MGNFDDDDFLIALVFDDDITIDNEIDDSIDHQEQDNHNHYKLLENEQALYYGLTILNNKHIIQDNDIKNNYQLLLTERKQQQQREYSTLLMNLALKFTNNNIKSSMNEL